MRLALSPILVAILISSGHADTISIRADTWCPFNCDPASAKPGYMIEVAKAVFEKAGHKIDYQNLNWSRALAGARDGKFTAVVGAGDQEVTDNHLVTTPAVPLGKNVNCFLVQAGSSWTYTGPASLTTTKIGTIQDYSYGDTLDAFFKSHTGVAQSVTGDDALKRNLEKLGSKRLDAVVDDRAVLLYTLSSNKLTGQFKEAGCENEANSHGLFIAFSPKDAKSPSYAKLLADGVVSMRKSGALKAILDKYGVPDWEK
jgi:polar amino acid transport system substrate-binding protein